MDLTKEEVTKRANVLCDMLGKGFKPYVSYRHGYYYCAEALDGLLTVWPSNDGSQYYCMVNTTYKHAGNYEWDSATWYDPRDAVLDSLMKMKRELLTVRDMVKKLDELLN